MGTDSVRQQRDHRLVGDGLCKTVERENIDCWGTDSVSEEREIIDRLGTESV